MPLTMSRPFKHPKTGIYWLRRIVPAGLRSVVGKREEKRSLGTRDPNEARRLHALAMAEINERWANLRAGERSLTEREANEMARPLTAKFIYLYSDEPSQQPWYPQYYDQLILTQAFDATDDNFVKEEGCVVVTEKLMELLLIESMRTFAFAQAKYYIDHHGLQLDNYSHLKFVRACAIALQRASLILKEAEESGKPVEIDDTLQLSEPIKDKITLSPSIRQSAPQSNVAGLHRDANINGPTLTSLLAAWWAEAKTAGLKPSTYESYSHSVKAFVAFLGHDDAGRVTGDDVVGFKDFRLTTVSKRTGRAPSAKTVKDSDLAGLKTVFGWAKDNRKLTSNPASGVTIKVPRPQKLRSKGFTHEEANAILRAALHHKQGLEAWKTWAAKRWVPWLCAFTGGRVGELAQLRKEDVKQQGNYWILRITPEAGTVKTNQAREVVLHPQLVELGFTLFVEEAATGHLFLMPRNDSDVLKPLQTLKNRLAEFGRQTVLDKGVAPNHGWRHRFKTVGMEAGIDLRILDAIQGHAPQNASGKYGDVTINTMAAAIIKIPYFDIS